MIRGGQFLTIVFDCSRTREYFEVCLKVLILARDNVLDTKDGDHQEPLNCHVGADIPQTTVQSTSSHNVVQSRKLEYKQAPAIASINLSGNSSGHSVGKGESCSPV